MISLELATLIAPHVASLSLIVTSAGGYFWNDIAPWNGVVSLARMTFIEKPEDNIPILLPMLYPQEFLDAPAIEYDQPSLTNYEVLKPMVLRRLTLARPQLLMGALSQMYGCVGHYVSKERLATIAKSIPKVKILIGDDDNLFVVWKGTGHGIFGCRSKEANVFLTRVMLEGRKKSMAVE
ncbi:hypothetical protein FRB97_004964 [Tulasnella sp. 331]|nr:hypothetical protein FRB97_004964 [Tulasnella sp. 331]